jgi:hypothetical protein
MTSTATWGSCARGSGDPAAGVCMPAVTRLGISLLAQAAYPSQKEADSRNLL